MLTILYTVLSIKPYIASHNIVLQIQLCRRAVSIKKGKKKATFIENVSRLFLDIVVKKTLGQETQH